LDGLACRLVFLKRGGTDQYKAWKPRLHGGRKYWNKQGGEHIIREACLGQFFEFSCS